MNFRNWLWFFLEIDGRVRQIYNGVVQSLNKKTHLPHSPMGWEEIGVIWERLLNRWGNIRNFAFPLKFPLEGGQILRNDFYKFNRDRRLFLLLMEFTSEVTTTHFKNYYKFFYKGELDFSTVKDNQGEETVEINIIEGGVQRALKAYENVEFDIPLNEENILIEHDGIIIDNNFQSIVNNGDSLDGGFYFKNHIIGLDMTSNEISAAGSAKSTLRTQVSNSNTNIRNTGQYTLKASVAGSIEVIWKFKLIIEYTPSAPGINPAAVFKVVVRSIDESNIAVNQIELLSRTAAEGIPGVYHLQGTTSIPANIKDEFYLYAFCNVEGATGDTQIRCIYEVEDDTIFKLIYQFRGATTYIPALLPEVLHRKLVGKITGNESDAVSVLLPTCSVALTSGDAIRGLKVSSLKISYANFFKAYDTYLLAGQGVENKKIVFEDRQHFFKTGNSTQLGVAKDFTVEDATDLIGSSIKIGHQEQTINNVNGKYDFCGYIIYKVPIESGAAGEIDLQSPFKAGPYEIETLRIDLEGKLTTDDLKDNTIYAIDAIRDTTLYVAEVSFVAVGNVMVTPDTLGLQAGQKTRITGSVSNNYDFDIISVILAGATKIVTLSNPIISVTDEPNVVVTIDVLSGHICPLNRTVIPDSGVPHPETTFNVALRPAELIKKHFPWIAGWTTGYETGILEFIPGNRNNDLVVAGKADKNNIQIAALGEKMFLPKYFTFGTEVPTDLVEVLNNDVNKDFATDWNQHNYEGFLFKAGIAANTEKEQTFKLLSAPGNNLNNLIL